MEHSQYLLKPGPADSADRLGFGMLPKIAAAQSQGRFAVVEHPILPGVLIAPVHTHSREDEFTIVLAGRVGALIGGETVFAGAGDILLKPRGIPHTLWNAGEDTARVLEIISPAGFEAYFTELEPLLSQRDEKGRPDIGALMALGGKYGLSFDMEALPALLERHRLRLV